MSAASVVCALWGEKMSAKRVGLFSQASDFVLQVGELLSGVRWRTRAEP